MNKINYVTRVPAIRGKGVEVTGQIIMAEDTRYNHPPTMTVLDDRGFEIHGSQPKHFLDTELLGKRVRLTVNMDDGFFYSYPRKAYHIDEDQPIRRNVVVPDVKYSDRVSIHLPTVDHIERGMLMKAYRDFGYLIDEVNPETDTIGAWALGMKPRLLTMPTSNICVVWAIGGWAAAVRKIGQFSEAMSNRHKSV